MLLLSLLSALLIAAPVAHAGSWRRPVEGEPLRSFSLGPNPYARGRHRGVDLAAAPGSPVRSACAGRVSFAGRVPGGGLTVSVRCGRHVATYQQLGALAVRRGRPVVAGMRIGVAGRSIDPRTRRAHVHLGVRVAASGRYIDPLTLIGAARPAVPPLPPARLPRGAPPGRPPAAGPRAVPLGRAPAAGPRAVPLGRVPAPVPRAVPLGRVPAPVPRAVPLGRVPAPVPRAVPLGRAPAPVPRAVPLGRAPAPVPRAVPLGRAPAPVPLPRPAVPADAPAIDRAPGLDRPAPAPALPWVVWAGLASVGLALPIGGVLRFRRRRGIEPRRVALTAR